MSATEYALSRKMQRWVEALTWHEMLAQATDAELTSSVVRDWQIWYADPENQRQFDDSARLAIDGCNCRQQALPSNAEITADKYDSALPIAVWREAASSTGTYGHWLASEERKPRLARGLIVAAIAVAAVVFWRSWPWTDITHTAGSVALQTPIGRVKEVRLSDGSAVTLGGGTRLSVIFSTRVRSVQLLRGEAWFRVAHDRKWPFVVLAGDGAIRALGTAFLVTRDSDRVVVTVTEGTVAVTPSPLVKLSPTFGRRVDLRRLSSSLRVTSGEEVSYRDNGTVASVTNADTRTATAWTHGRLIFNDEPLRYVIENVNRYFTRPISATPQAGRLRFSGVIFDDGIEDWLHALSGILPVELDERGDIICVRTYATRIDQQSCSPMR